MSQNLAALGLPVAAGIVIRFGVSLAALLASPVVAVAANDSDWAECGRADARAIAGCTRIIQSGDEDQTNLGTAYNNRGVGYASIKQLDRAMADYNIAIELNPGLAEAYANRGLAYGNDDYERAIVDFNRTIQLKPTYATAYAGRCDAYVTKGDFDRAIADCSIALQLEPNASTYRSRADAYHSKKRVRPRHCRFQPCASTRSGQHRRAQGPRQRLQGQRRCRSGYRGPDRGPKAGADRPAGAQDFAEMFSLTRANTPRRSTITTSPSDISLASPRLGTIVGSLIRKAESRTLPSRISTTPSR